MHINYNTIFYYKIHKNLQFNSSKLNYYFFLKNTYISIIILK